MSATSEVTAGTVLDELHRAVLDWYATAARPLPWRDPGCSPWGVFVSEIMAQQTPLARVEPVWREWLVRWPTPAALAGAAPGEAVRAWGRLGYPRRALRLRDAAMLMVARHGGHVPEDEADLLALPGVGAYPAAAVAAFAFGARTVVVDTNVRRVLTRVRLGQERAAASLTARERDLAAAALPLDPRDAATWNVAVMELGALVCTARAPACGRCPIAARCAWALAGHPAFDGPARSGQAWHGTDRQVRGRIIDALRQTPDAVPLERLVATSLDPAQVERCIGSLVADGLIEAAGRAGYRLPS